jgi:hypothetical protein
MEVNMTSPIPDFTKFPPQHTGSSPATAQSNHVGLGSQPTTLSSATNEPTGPDVWGTVFVYCETFGDFLRQLVVKALDGIRAAIGATLGWFGSFIEGSSSSETQWQLPIETSPAIETSAQDPFRQLPITQEEQRKIFTIVNTMGQSWLTLLRNKGTLETYGEQIQHVHPLKFLEYTFKHPTLPKDLESASKSSLTWTPFISGLSEKLRRVAATLPQYKASFARSINVNLNDLDPFFSTANWDALVRFLIDVKTAKRTSTWIEPAALPSAGTAPTTLIVTSPQIQPPTVSISTLPPVQTMRIADLPFTSEDARIVSNLLDVYSRYSSVKILWERNSLNRQWDELGLRHPIRILTHLKTQPEMIQRLRTLTHKKLFKSALISQFNRHNTQQMLPYVSEFASICQLEPRIITQQIQDRNWKGLLKNFLLTNV